MELLIVSREYWFKVIDMGQQNWALVDAAGAGVVVWFISDASGVFDEIRFDSVPHAADALMRNGFRRFAEKGGLPAFLSPPQPPFRRRPHPNGPIYSSGRFWR